MPATMPEGGEPRMRKRSLFSLIGSLPTTLIDLVKAEIDQLKDELLTKLKQLGIGVAMFAAAAAVLWFALAVLIAAAVLGLALVLPAWAAALIVGGVLLIVGVIVVLVGMRLISKGSDPVPRESIESLNRDVHTITGTNPPRDS